MSAANPEFHIVSVEDDPFVAKGLVLALESEGYRVSHFPAGEPFLEKLTDLEPSLLILDIRLPGMGGYQVCRELRARGFTFPVLMLTARDEEADKISGLEGGADDYMVKPYGIGELLSRIRARLRRSYGELSRNASEPEKSYQFGSCVLHRDRMVLTRDNRDIDLTPMEYKLLLFLLKNRNRVFNRKDILRAVWSADDEYYGDERTVDVHIRHLRKKIEEDPSRPVYLKTVRGEGYSFT